MAIYCVTGNLGSGKSLVCVGRIFEAIKAGRRVATNFNLRMEHLTRGKGRTNVLRLPDVPCLADFQALGIGSPDCENARPGQFFDEKRNGVIVLDEISSMLDSRSWAELGRKELLDWLKHSRKLGWDIYFIAQHESTLDVQARKMLLEHLVVCKRLDRVPIPFLGFILKLLGFSGRFVKLHLATVRYGASAVHSVVSERWWTWGRKFLWMGEDLYAAYDTRQIFRRQRSPELNDEKGVPLSAEPGEVAQDYRDRNGTLRRIKADDNSQGIYQYLDRYSAPWIHARFTWRDRLSSWLESKGHGRLAQLVRDESERGPWFDAWLCEMFGPPSYQLGAESFASWYQARRDTAPEGGPKPSDGLGGEGKAAHPALEAA